MDISMQKQLIANQLSEMEKRLEKINSDLARTHSRDFEEQAVERENDEVLEEIARETLDSIRRLKTAMEKIEEGNYGVCKSCGETISHERLKALPDTALCINCATE